MSEVLESKIITGSGEVQLIQNEIEIYTKKIEHEKINLRLAKERYQKQLDTLLKLQGKPILTKEKKTKILDKKERKSVKEYQKPDKLKLLKQQDFLEHEVEKNELILEKIVNETNLINLENQEIRKKIEELRKEKINSMQMLNMLTTQGSIVTKELEELQINNMINEGKSKDIGSRKGFPSINSQDDLQLNNNMSNDERKKEKGAILLKEIEFKHTNELRKLEIKEFEEERDQLEGNYQEIIEENIRREREHKKEILKKKIGELKKEETLKLEEEDTIKDRTPILDLLIDKIKFFNSDKKKMIERYQRNSHIIKESLEQMMEYLGIDSYSELPFVLEKMEEQHGSIEMLDSKLTDEIDKLEKEKAEMENKIKNLKVKNTNSIEVKSTFITNRNDNIERLLNQIKQLNNDINKRRQFFTSLKNPTDSFLSYMDKLFISEYIPYKVAINKDVDYTESNVKDILGNIQDYYKFIIEIEKSAMVEKKPDNNKELDRLKNDMIQKLDNLKKDIIPSSFFKTDIKQNVYTNNNTNNTSFDDIIKSKALEIISRVNQISELNDKKKKK